MPFHWDKEEGCFDCENPERSSRDLEFNINITF